MQKERLANRKKVMNMAEQTTAITVATIMNEQSGTSICSITPEPGNREQAKAVFNAMNNPTGRVKDLINKEILVENILVEVNDLLNDETGEIDHVPRCVLITPKGESYTAISKGILTSIKNAYQAFGPAPWEGGIAFTVRQVQVGRGSMLTLEMV